MTYNKVGEIFDLTMKPTYLYNYDNDIIIMLPKYAEGFINDVNTIGCQFLGDNGIINDCTCRPYKGIDWILFDMPVNDGTNLGTMTNY